MNNDIPKEKMFQHSTYKDTFYLDTLHNTYHCTFTIMKIPL